MQVVAGIRHRRTVACNCPKVNQENLHELVRELGLSKADAYTTATLLRKFEVLHPTTKVTFYRTREKECLDYFDVDHDIVHCSDIVGLFKKLDLCNSAEQIFKQVLAFHRWKC